MTPSQPFDLTAAKALVERLQSFSGLYSIYGAVVGIDQAREAAATLQSALEEIERLRGALTIAEAALEDLGACDDPDCREPNCPRSLSVVRTALTPEAGHD